MENSGEVSDKEVCQHRVLAVTPNKRSCLSCGKEFTGSDIVVPSARPVAESVKYQMKEFPAKTIR